VEADRQKLEARAEAGSYAPRGVKSFDRRAAELRRHPPSTDREQALADLDTGVREERERVARRISAAEFRRRRDGQGLADLILVEGERGAGAQHVGLWRDNPGGACATAGVQSRRVSGSRGGGRGWARTAGGGNLTSRNDYFGIFAIYLSYFLL
jgi:hypothetical protein